MQPDFDKDLFLNLTAKKLSGNAGPEDLQVLAYLLNEHPEARQEYAKLEATWHLAGEEFVPEDAEIQSYDAQQAWKKVKDNLHQTKVVPLSNKSGMPMKTWLSIAAGIALVLTIGYWFLLKRGDQLNMVSGSTLAQIEYYDGSTISLDTDGELSYNPEPNQKERRFMQTKGSVYYAVEKNPEKPFVVSTSLAEVTVLGTRFMIEISADSLVLAVEEGKVQIVPTNSREAAIVSAGEARVVSADGKSTSKPYSPNALSWANRQLRFANTPLSEVVKDLEAMYRVEISLDSSLHTCKLTGSFRKKSLEEVLESIAETLDLDVRKTGNRFIISGKGC